MTTISRLTAAAIFAANLFAQPPQPPAKIHATMNQLMQGIVYPNANIIFSTQTEDPAKVKPAANPAMSTDALTSSFGKWQAVENSALALSESANLLMLPGRKCSNGLDVPLKNADWGKFVEELRGVGTVAYKAAQEKNLDAIIAATDPLTIACQNCHLKYRDGRKPENRCK